MTPGESLKVGIDVSPLRQTRAGTARYLNGLLGAGLPGVDNQLTGALQCDIPASKGRRGLSHRDDRGSCVSS